MVFICKTHLKKKKLTKVLYKSSNKIIQVNKVDQIELIKQTDLKKKSTEIYFIKGR